MRIAKCALFGDRRENKKEACQFGPVLWVHLVALRCAVQAPPVTVFQICDIFSLHFRHFYGSVKYRTRGSIIVFAKLYNSALKYFTRIENARNSRPATRNSNISLPLIIRIIALLSNRAFYCMRLPYPCLFRYNNFEIYIRYREHYGGTCRC